MQYGDRIKVVTVIMNDVDYLSNIEILTLGVSFIAIEKNKNNKTEIKIRENSPKQNEKGQKMAKDLTSWFVCIFTVTISIFTYDFYLKTSIVT